MLYDHSVEEDVPPEARAAFTHEVADPGSREDEPRPRLLYHYTTATGFERILMTRQLRATNFSFLNDPSEVAYGRGIALQVMEQSTPREANLSFFRGRLPGRFEHDAVAEVYVACFTELEDDLSQWRAYGNATTARYAIGFDTDALLHRVTTPSATFDRILYDAGQQISRVTEIIKRAEHYIQRENESGPTRLYQFAEMTAQLIAQLVPFLKAPAYTAEKEWRLVIHRPLHDLRDILFDTSRGVVRPYLALGIEKEPASLIRKIYVLSAGRVNAAVKAAEMVAARAGLANVTIHPSAVPFAE